MTSAEKDILSNQIKSWALEEGFSHCGISKAEALTDHDARLREWLSRGYAANMQYMHNNHEKRIDPRKLLEGTLSVISVLHPYYPSKNIKTPGNLKISKYAYGRDYHKVIKKKLNRIIQKIKMVAGPVNARAFTDSAPVLERAWAVNAGLGWIGKNTCLINPQVGSFVFIAEILINLELSYNDKKQKDFCGGCMKCLESCPTKAFIAPRMLDARKCISYHTIENKGQLPENLAERFKNWIFGCDICQDVCPWNRTALIHQEPDYEPSDKLVGMTRENWESLSEDDFNELFAGSAVKRAGYAGLMRNIKFVTQKTNQCQAEP